MTLFGLQLVMRNDLDGEKVITPRCLFLTREEAEAAIPAECHRIESTLKNRFAEGQSIENFGYWTGKTVLDFELK